MVADYEEWNERVRAWTARTKDAGLSRREYSDSWAKLMRPRSIELLNGAMRLGWMAPAEERASAIQTSLAEFGLGQKPKSEWTEFCFELDLILIAMEDRVDGTTGGYSKLGRSVEREKQKLEAIRSRFYDFNHDIDFSVAAMFSKADVYDNFRKIDELILSLKTVSKWLADNRQAPRWRDNARREYRINLAVSLSSFFENEFQEEAKPVGGSESYDLGDTNAWTRFYQAIAFIMLKERVSPDRQAVLWEAYSLR